MIIGDKKLEQLKKMPAIQSAIFKSKDGKFMVHKTTITDIKPVNYYETVIEKAPFEELEDWAGDSLEFPFIKMLHNPNPLTPLQERFLSAIRNKFIDIRNPHKDVEGCRSFEFYLEHTKKFGTIPKIRFKPNSLAVKEEIMKDVGYIPIIEKDHWRARRNAAAKAFDSHWDNLMFRLVKAGRMLAQFNQMFAEDRQTVSNLITLLQRCIDPQETEGKIHPKDPHPIKDSPTYAEELAQLE